MTLRSASRLALPNAVRDDRPGLAVMSICGAILLASTMDAVVKFLSGGYPIHQLLAVRCGVALPLLAAFALWRTGSLAVARGDWKLLWFHDGPRVELYDLATDLGETRDVAASHPDMVRSLLADLDAWYERTGASRSLDASTGEPIDPPSASVVR